MQSKVDMNEQVFDTEGLLDGKYKYIKVLGKGGMSTVYLAENVNLETLWAIKKISKNDNLVKKLPIESNILKKLNHPALPRIVDIIESREYIYIVQDFIEGISLDKKLEKAGKFSEKKVIKWSKQICDVLIYLHSYKPNPIIYRDMKPSNIILTPWGDIKLVDFGVAREYKNSNKNDTVYIGTRGYAAPEQYGGGQSNVKTDIYSFGVTLFHLLTGQGPHKFQSGIKLPESFRGNISHKMIQVISKCTRYNPEERYQTAYELKKDIEELERNTATIDIDKIKTSLYRKKLILTVWDNPEFACELAYITSKKTRLNVMIADLDLLSPSIDLFLNIKKYPEELAKERITNESGINIILDSIEKGSFTNEDFFGSSIKRKDLKNLYIITGNYRLENYEYYNNDGIVKFIEKAGQVFDVLILAVNKSIYDSFTLLCLIKSDLNIIPIKANINKFREFNNYIVALKEKQQIPMGKNKFVAFDYNSLWHLSKDIIEEVTQQNFLGWVSHCSKREKLRNTKMPYAKKMSADVIQDYTNILRRLEILPDKNLIFPGGKFKKASL